MRIAVEPVVDERDKSPADEDDNPDIVEAVPLDGDSFRVRHQGVVRSREACTQESISIFREEELERWRLAQLTETDARRDEERRKPDRVHPAYARLRRMRERVGDPGEGCLPALAAVRDGFRRGLEKEVRCHQDGGGRAEQVRPLYSKGAIRFRQRCALTGQIRV